jgi:mono/diheme cytochrome c family protein
MMHSRDVPVRTATGLPVLLAALLIDATAFGLAPPAPPDDDVESLQPGVIARFSPEGAEEPAAVRIVADLTAYWGAGSPDPRVPADRFQVRWSGSLLIQTPGPHRFFARTDGSVILRVAGRIVLEPRPGVDGSVTIDLPAGFVPIAMEYQHGQGAAHVAIDWSAGSFEREPLPARLLFHDPAGIPHPDRFEAGRRQADRLGCANCHALLDLPRHPHLGPPLTDAGIAISGDWRDAWLSDPARVRPRSRMPAFGPGLNPEEVADLTAFLASVAPRPRESVAEVKMALNVATADKGQLLFRSVGCLGCHTLGSVAAVPDETAAPDLADLGRKRTPLWLTEYLQHPKKGGPSKHRADLRLSADDSAHLASYLVSDPPPALAVVPRAHADAGGQRQRPGSAARGKELANRLRCAACHEVPGLSPPKADLPLTAASRPSAGCLAEAAEAAPIPVPRYDLTEPQRQDLRAFIAGLPRQPAPTSPETLAGDTIRRLNCLGCHLRDGQGGTMIGPQVAALLAADPDLGSLKGTLTPPNLSAVGDKLHPEYLAQAVRGAAPTTRPWLAIRMPAFSFEPGEAESIATDFQQRDRIESNPDGQIRDKDKDKDTPTRPDPATFEAAVALIGQRGFGCVNCHVLAGKIPPGGEPETLGPDLALAHLRMTQRYFDRWIGNPQRIIPGTPMPQFLQPVATLPGPLDRQLDTIWQLLGSTRVAEAAAQGTREIVKRQGDRPMVVRDMVLLPGAPDTEYTPRGVTIGLKNDHALVFDTDRLTWLAAWHRGFLSRTKSGRLWEWHPEGDRLWTTPRRQPPVVFIDRSGQVLPPDTVRGRFGHFAALDFAGSDLRLTYDLNPPKPHPGAPIEVAETVQPIPDGWMRTLQVVTTPLPEGLRPALVVQPPVPASDRDATSFTWTAGRDKVTLRVLGASPLAVSLADDKAARLFLLDHGTAPARIQLSVRPGP